jgi:hypothetical protein
LRLKITYAFDGRFSDAATGNPQGDDSMFARALLVAVLVFFSAALESGANDWIFDYGPYSANKKGHRVDQYKKNKAAVKIPYSKYFSNDGPSPYIPYWYWQDELGPLNGFYGGGGGYGGGMYGGGISGTIPISNPFGGFAIP